MIKNIRTDNLSVIKLFQVTFLFRKKRQIANSVLALLYNFTNIPSCRLDEPKTSKSFYFDGFFISPKSGYH